MTERKRILFIIEAMGGGVFTYVVDHVALNASFGLKLTERRWRHDKV